MLSVYLFIPPLPLLNAWTNVCETWYVHYGTWAHFNGVLHKSLPSVCLDEYPLVFARQRFGENVTASTNTQAKIEILLDASFYTRFVSYQRKIGGWFFPELDAKFQHLPAFSGQLRCYKERKQAYEILRVCLCVCISHIVIFKPVPRFLLNLV
jgi:hypothetical protein